MSRRGITEPSPRRASESDVPRIATQAKILGLSTDVFMGIISDMSMQPVAKPRLLRAVNPPLGSYFRVGRDHKPLQALLAEDRAAFTGLVFDARDHDRHRELRGAAAGRVETVLDTKAFELSTVGGAANPRLAGLPWAGDQLPHTPELLRGPWGKQVAELIADEVAERQYGAVLTPTHFLRRVDDEWLEVDLELAQRLRAQLDQRRLRDVTIYFSLTMHSSVLADAAARARIVERLASAPIDALWLRIHPFSAADAGPDALRRYIEGARDLQRLGLPLIGEHTGTAGVALLAFGAVGGIESGITSGERFVVSALLKPPSPNAAAFTPAPRVYLAALGTFVSRDQAKALLAKTGMRTMLGCRDTSCCARGPADTDLDPRRHFLLQRQREVTEIGQRPEPVRPSLYLEEFLRPATDFALRAAKVDLKLERTRKRLEGWRLTLGAMNQQGPPTTVALPPEGKRTHPHVRRSA
jgi:hypothetical protein